MLLIRGCLSEQNDVRVHLANTAKLDVGHGLIVGKGHLLSLLWRLLTRQHVVVHTFRINVFINNQIIIIVFSR